MLLLSLFILFVAAVTALFLAAPLPYGVMVTLGALASFSAITLSVYLARRWFDRRTFVSLGLRWDRKALRDLGFGILLSGLMMGLIYLLEWAFGWLHFSGFAWETQSAAQVAGNLLGAFALFAIVGWQEELISRGYHLQNLAEGLNLPWGLAISSALFALAHLLNPNFSLMALVGLFASGIFLAYGYLRTRRLWLSIGLHIGWNFFEGTIFGFPVSGAAFFTLVRQSVNGPALFTGGAFGPEAGLTLLPSLLLGIILIHKFTEKD